MAVQVFAALLVSVSLVLPASAQLADGYTLPLTFPADVLEGDKGQCPSEGMRNQVLGKIQEKVRAALSEKVLPLFCASGDIDSCRAPNCSQILESNPNSESGYYWIQPSPGNAVQVYCDMTSTRCCNETRGWTRIAYLNMNDSTQQCPSSWREIPAGPNHPIRTCARRRSASCDSVNYPSNGVRYSRVCGRVLGYQYGNPDAFHKHNSQNVPPTIDEPYVDGVSVTYNRTGSQNRTHIWTFAGAQRDSSHLVTLTCPCTNNQSAADISVPQFVGQDYFCETGRTEPDQDRFYETNPLWDGQDCSAESQCCSFNNPPWFCKQLAEDTTEDIEVRICSNAAITSEDTPVQLVEIYVM